jgi:tRNA uridine 5-carboxymethylaminomethyl modification enzyme
MFTSRAEFRLLLNGGSAELRLLEVAERYGLIDSSRLRKILEKRRRIERAVESGSANLCENGEELSAAEIEEVSYRLAYAGYWEREKKQIERLRSMEDVPIPEDLDYGSIGSLRNESRQKLEAIRPGTIGQASRICGIGAVDVGLIRIAMCRRSGLGGGSGDLTTASSV